MSDTLTALNPPPTGPEDAPTAAHAETDRCAETDISRRSPDGINLRRWFDLYLAWMIALAVLLLIGRVYAEAGHRSGLAVLSLAGYAIYLSLCCTFFPAPTTWAVMLVASNGLALIEAPVPRVIAVSLLGALATSMANLNEYHIFTFLLRYRRIGRVRQTRLYRWAEGWFAVSPFTIISVFSFIPIPVDVVRWLAIAYRYSRSRFFGAYMLGRSLRYAIWAVSAVWLDLGFWQIAVFQGLLITAAALKIVFSAIRRRRGEPEDPPG